MGDKKTTLFELHMHGNPQFGPKLFGGSGSEEADEEMEGGGETEMEAEETSGGSRIPRLVMTIVALAVLSVAVRKIRSKRSGEGGELIGFEPEDIKPSP